MTAKQNRNAMGEKLGILVRIEDDVINTLTGRTRKKRLKAGSIKSTPFCTVEEQEKRDETQTVTIYSPLRKKGAT